MFNQTSPFYGWPTIGDLAAAFLPFGIGVLIAIIVRLCIAALEKTQAVAEGADRRLAIVDTVFTIGSWIAIVLGFAATLANLTGIYDGLSGPAKVLALFFGLVLLIPLCGSVAAIGSRAR
jgi:hypothetical protein